MVRNTLTSLLLTLSLLFSSNNLYSSNLPQTAASQRRIVFRIATIEESQGVRRLLSLATVEGAPGTDFDVNLQGTRFNMNAHFLTDLVGPGVLKVRSSLDTRRFYGYSERNLPLFEEDNQRETLELSFDEAIVLLPFGRNGGDDRLKIEITPAWSEETVLLPSGALRPLTIKIPHQSPGGAVSVYASSTPHHFAVEATLLEDGSEIAGGVSDYLIEESRELTLRPTGQASLGLEQNSFVLNLKLSNYASTRPADEVQVDFDFYSTNRSLNNRQVASKWSGIAALGSPLTYNLSDTSFGGSGKKYELRLKVNLASQ
jgi:hypothetical protein